MAIYLKCSPTKNNKYHETNSCRSIIGSIDYKLLVPLWHNLSKLYTCAKYRVNTRRKYDITIELVAGGECKWK